MDLRPSEEQQQLRDALRRLYGRRLTELVDALPEPPRHDAARDLDDARAIGLPGLGLPERCGGAGAFDDLALAHVELGRGLSGAAPVVVGEAGRLLVRATGDARDDLLGRLADGEWLATVALADHGGSCRRVVLGPDSQAVLVIDISGEVRVVPSDAGELEWTAEPDGCDLTSWSLRVAPTGSTGDRLMLSDDSRRAYLADVTVLAAARQLGGARTVLDRTIEHVRTREQFDRPIGTFQAVQHQLADVATEVDATELAVLQAAWAVDASLAPTEVRRLADIAALAAGSAFRRATVVAHQLHGGMGFVLDSPLHLWSARAIADPTVPRLRRDVLDDLAETSGIRADGITAPPDHRVTART